MGDKKLKICIRQPSSRLFIRAEEEEEEEEDVIFLDFLFSSSSTSMAGLCLAKRIFFFKDINYGMQ